MKVDFIVLAAGKGKRMGQGDLPKVLLPLAGRPIAQHLLDTISSMKEAAVRMVVGYQASKVKSSLKVKRNTKWVIQKNQLGTAHAVKQAVPLLYSSRFIWRCTSCFFKNYKKLNKSNYI